MPVAALSIVARHPWRWLRALSWPEWRLHPWRHATVAVAVAVGVALAYSVHLINASALSEFAGAVRAANGEPDLTIAARTRAGFDDALIDSLLADPSVRVASPVVEVDVAARTAAGGDALSLRVLGIDALRVAAVAPSLLPHVAAGEDRLALLDPDAAFANPAALQRLQARSGDTIELHGAAGWQRFRIAGTLALGGSALLVVDVAAGQARLGMAGRLSRIDLRLMPGVEPERWLAARHWPSEVRVAAAHEAEQRVSNLSRAYRVNLSVLALVALFVGGFLAYSVLALSVAQRTPTFALLGVLGLTARERRLWVLGEALCVGIAGTALGLALGVLLAWIALRVLGGDLGGGYFAGAAPSLQFDAWGALLYGALGVAAALAGAWWPARAAERLAPAQALKGLSSLAPRRSRWLVALALLAAASVLALLPPWHGVPLAAYASVALLLAGGVAMVPPTVQLLLARRVGATNALLLLARERARHQRDTASAAVAGVVASVALSIALLVMVGSFRDAVSSWLDGVLPAELYLRTAGGPAAADANTLPPTFAEQAAAIPGVVRVRASRVAALSLDPARPALTLIVRPVDDGANALPWLGSVQWQDDDAVFVSEPAAALYGWRVGERIELPLPAGARPLRVAGIWRDYARQFGALVIRPSVWREHGGDDRLNEVALWLAPGADAGAVSERLRGLAGDVPVQTSTAGELRALSLAIFDRSFAVTRYLQAVAIAVGLVGVAASLSAQVLARRKEFGLLVHLGLTRGQVLAIVSGEAAAWLTAGVALGIAIGLAVSVVLVDVVNPQSFHWTMPLQVPWLRVAALGLAVLLLGVATAALTARHAASHSAVRAVKEDW
ncbi:MAG TPA: ABC transporter permease [Burkholderiaceae bacterium]|nr:ABC transporter permease [Burkholderiaceae bacterium]